MLLFCVDDDIQYKEDDNDEEFEDSVYGNTLLLCITTMISLTAIENMRQPDTGTTDTDKGMISCFGCDCKYYT